MRSRITRYAKKRLVRVSLCVFGATELVSSLALDHLAIFSNNESPPVAAVTVLPDSLNAGVESELMF